MSESSLYQVLIIASFLLAAAVFITLFFFKAPYGRYATRSWGPFVSSRWGWVLMEGPAALLFALYFFSSLPHTDLVRVLFLGLWEAHYIQRAFIYPFTRTAPNKPMPVAVVAMGICFNAGNTYINGRFLFTLSSGYPISWLTDIRFLAGITMFVLGYAINRWADYVLSALRKPGESGYRIPEGGLYRWISCPNYLGEIIEWSGWAMATWSLPGLSFAVWTFANLAPRAWSHHCWYHRQFPEYPRDRRILLPWVW